MQFRKYGKADPNALEIEIELHVENHIKLAILRRLNHLLGIIKQKYPTKEKEFISQLNKLYTSQEPKVLSKSYNIAEMISDFDSLKEDSLLVSKIIKFGLELLDVNSEELVRENVKIKQRNFIRSFLIPRYNNLETLTKILPRDEAISLYKFYLQNYLAIVSSENNNQVENLGEFENKYFVSKNDDEPDGFYGLCGVTHGKFFYRKDNCLWVDAIQDYCSDKEIRHYICCYGDFHSIQQENENFILTMKHTVANGDPYCDCIVHDTRMDWDLTHPKAKFWDTLKPVKE